MTPVRSFGAALLAARTGKAVVAASLRHIHAYIPASAWRSNAGRLTDRAIVLPSSTAGQWNSARNGPAARATIPATSLRNPAACYTMLRATEFECAEESFGQLPRGPRAQRSAPPFVQEARAGVCPESRTDTREAVAAQTPTADLH